MSGHVIVSGTDTVSGTDGWASVTVDCPPGMVVTGGGANIAIGGVIVFGIAPFKILASYPSGLAAWRASATEAGLGTLNEWALNAYAICVNAP
jgi:hypothetical protein